MLFGSAVSDHNRGVPWHTEGWPDTLSNAILCSLIGDVQAQCLEVYLSDAEYVGMCAGDDIGMVLSPQCFHNLNLHEDIFNHSNIHFWEYMQPGYDALGFISCTGKGDLGSFTADHDHKPCLRLDAI